MPKVKQPNSRHCFVCGLENPIGLRLHFYEIEEGVVETEFSHTSNQSHFLDLASFQ